MPFIWSVFGFVIYFWSNENNEPIHFHIAKGTRGEHNTKFWLYSDGTIHLCHNKSRYKKQELRKIQDLQYNSKFVNRLINEWQYKFRYVKFIK